MFNKKEIAYIQRFENELSRYRYDLTILKVLYKNTNNLRSYGQLKLELELVKKRNFLSKEFSLHNFIKIGKAKSRLCIIKNNMFKIAKQYPSLIQFYESLDYYLPILADLRMVYHEVSFPAFSDYCVLKLIPLLYLQSMKTNQVYSDVPSFIQYLSQSLQQDVNMMISQKKEHPELSLEDALLDEDLILANHYYQTVGLVPEKQKQKDFQRAIKIFRKNQMLRYWR